MERDIFSAEIQELHRMLKWLRLHLAEGGVEDALIWKMELATEEAIVNIITHTYAGKKGKIEIGLDWMPETFAIVIRDWGPPFDPLTNAPPVEPEAPLQERQTGGLGLFFMRQLTDDLVYDREEGANVLTLIKRFSRKK